MTISFLREKILGFEYHNTFGSMISLEGGVKVQAIIAKSNSYGWVLMHLIRTPKES